MIVLAVPQNLHLHQIPSPIARVFLHARYRGVPNGRGGDLAGSVNSTLFGSLPYPGCRRRTRGGLVGSDPMQGVASAGRARGTIAIVARRMMDVVESRWVQTKCKGTPPSPCQVRLRERHPELHKPVWLKWHVFAARQPPWRWVTSFYLSECHMQNQLATHFQGFEPIVLFSSCLRL